MKSASNGYSRKENYATGPKPKLGRGSKRKSQLYRQCSKATEGTNYSVSFPQVKAGMAVLLNSVYILNIKTDQTSSRNVNILRQVEF